MTKWNITAAWQVQRPRQSQDDISLYRNIQPSEWPQPTQLSKLVNIPEKGKVNHLTYWRSFNTKLDHILTPSPPLIFFEWFWKLLWKLAQVQMASTECVHILYHDTFSLAKLWCVSVVPKGPRESYNKMLHITKRGESLLWVASQFLPGKTNKFILFFNAKFTRRLYFCISNMVWNERTVIIMDNLSLLTS